MDINFKGFKNVGVQRATLYNQTGRKAEVRILNCELTNDTVNKDLENFEHILKQAVNPLNHNFLRFCVINPENENTIFQINEKVFKINNKNLGLFQQVTNLLKRIITTPNNQFKVNNGYIESDDFIQSFILDEEDATKETIESMHRPQNVKSMAKEFIENITDSVDEFLS